MEIARSILRYVRISPKKTKIVADIVKGKGAGEALDILRFVRNKPAKFIFSAIKSAMANAQQKGYDPQGLKVRIELGRGPFLKRWWPSAYGRALPIKRKTTHIKITLIKED